MDSILIHNEITLNVEEFFSASERAAAFAIKIYSRCRSNAAQVYASTSSDGDEAVNIFYEDIESILNEVNAWYTMLIGENS